MSLEPKRLHRNGDTVGAARRPLDASSAEYAAQSALAAMMREPDRELLQIVQETSPGRDLSFHSSALQLARRMIERRIRIDVLQKATADEPAPVLVDRLSFSWAVLRHADVLIRSPKKAAMPTKTDRGFASALLEPVLGQPLADVFLEQILQDLCLGKDAAHLYHYWFFRKATTPVALPAPFGDAGQRNDLEAVRTVIWWTLRKRTEQFVQTPPGEPIRIEFEYVVEQTLAEIATWCGADIRSMPGLAGDVEAHLNRWLSFSRIESGSSDESAFEIARAFVRFNDLNTKLVVKDRASSPEGSGNGQVAELAAALRDHQATIQQYAEENRKLEQRVAELLAVPAGQPAPLPDEEPAAGDSVRELREVLKLIDSKYSFDVLNSVQLGHETHLTLRSFVAHIFYSLRKRGFAEYPQAQEFQLSYEESGLYDCDGFAIPPGASAPVRVSKKGWALVTKERVTPIRRAQLRLHR